LINIHKPTLHIWSHRSTIKLEVKLEVKK